jgi:hypothetical protein
VVAILRPIASSQRRGHGHCRCRRATDKHREIVLCAAALKSVSLIAPELDDESVTMLMAQPGPVVEVANPGLLGMVSRATGQGGAHGRRQPPEVGPGIDWPSHPIRPSISTSAPMTDRMCRLTRSRI